MSSGFNDNNNEIEGSAVMRMCQMTEKDSALDSDVNF